MLHNIFVSPSSSTGGRIPTWIWVRARILHLFFDSNCICYHQVSMACLPSSCCTIQRGISGLCSVPQHQARGSIAVHIVTAFAFTHKVILVFKELDIDEEGDKDKRRTLLFTGATTSLRGYTPCLGQPIPQSNTINCATLRRIQSLCNTLLNPSPSQTP